MVQHSAHCSSCTDDDCARAKLETRHGFFVGIHGVLGEEVRKKHVQPPVVSERFHNMHHNSLLPRESVDHWRNTGKPEADAKLCLPNSRLD
jgi:hypothetical protein